MGDLGGTWILQVQDLETGLWPGELKWWRQITGNCVSERSAVEMEERPHCHLPWATEEMNNGEGRTVQANS